MIPTFRHRLEYGALLAVRGLVARLPYRIALAIGWGLAFLGFHVFRYRRAEAVRRIRSVLGVAAAGRRAEAIAWASFRTFLFAAVDALRADRIDAAWVAAHVTDEGVVERLRALSAGGRGLILAVPHMGSWELGGALARPLGLPLFSIAGRQKNPLFNAFLNRQRNRSGIAILVRGEDSLKGILRNLKKGQHFAILPDVRMPEPGLAVPFLGGTANVGGGMALFARQADTRVLPFVILREGWTRHRLRPLDAVAPDPAAPRDADLQRMTETVFAAFEQAIRANPGQWFWYNKRWILDPVAVPAAPPAATPPPPPG